jgi:DNA-directed RNA polymerase sigma subunit (sigma70/sigma32)
MGEKIDYMYNYLDFDNDRAIVRDRFLTQMNKRATLADIGESLD